MNEDVGAVFAALADATRRTMLHELVREGSTTVPALTAMLPISRQAVAKHLSQLSAAGLVRGRREGRETRYTVTPAPLEDAVAWIVQTGSEWDDRLARLGSYVSPDGAG